MRRRADFFLGLASLPFLLYLAVPIVALFYSASLSDIIATVQQEEARQAITLSLATTIATVGVTILAGTPVAYWLSRSSRRPLRRAVDTLIDLPTVLPPAVAGLALLMAFGRRGLLGAYLYPFGIRLAFTSVAVVMAQTFVAGPLYVRAAAIGFADMDPELKEAAALDGGSRWQVFWNVTVPVCWSALLSGIITTWARALGEFGATILFAGNFPGTTQTMPLAIYLGFEQNLDLALALSALLIAISFVALMLVKLFLHREWR